MFIKAEPAYKEVLGHV